MQAQIHPKLNQVNVTCSCGNSFQTQSTMDQDLQLDVCSECHPFYTGKQKLVDTTGRIESFNKRYRRKGDNNKAG